MTWQGFILIAIAGMATPAAFAASGADDPDQRAPRFGAPRIPDSSRLAVAAAPTGAGAQRALDELAHEGIVLERDGVRTEVAQAAAAPVAAPAATPAATPAVVAVAGEHRFVARGGEPLSSALASYLARQNWDLEWDSPQDFVIQRNYEIAVPGEADLRATLVRILTPYHLSAVIHNAPPQRVVAVTAAAAHER